MLKKLLICCILLVCNKSYAQGIYYFYNVTPSVRVYPRTYTPVYPSPYNNPYYPRYNHYYPNLNPYPQWQPPVVIESRPRWFRRPIYIFR